jgi:hypothetical protein
MKYANGISLRSRYTLHPRKNTVDLCLLLIYTISRGDYENEQAIAQLS